MVMIFRLIIIVPVLYSTVTARGIGKTIGSPEKARPSHQELFADGMELDEDDGRWIIPYKSSRDQDAAYDKEFQKGIGKPVKDLFGPPEMFPNDVEDGRRMMPYKIVSRLGNGGMNARKYLGNEYNDDIEFYYHPIIRGRRTWAENGVSVPKSVNISKRSNYQFLNSVYSRLNEDPYDTPVGRFQSGRPKSFNWLTGPNSKCEEKQMQMRMLNNPLTF